MFLTGNEILSAEYNDVGIADSGATRHTTFRRDWFTTFSTKGAQKGVEIASTLVDGVWKSCVLKDVRFVPKAKVNLFSVTYLAKKGILTNFTRTGCIVFDENDPDTLLANGCIDSNDLVRMAFKHSKVDRMYYTSNENVSSASLQQWHRQLGHVNVATIKNMCSNESVSGID